MLTARTFRCQVKKLLRQLELEGPAEGVRRFSSNRTAFDVELFCKRLGQKKSIPILLQSYPMPLGLSAFFAVRLRAAVTRLAEGRACAPQQRNAFRSRYDEVYVIFYQERASLFFQEYVCFHELAHILLRHPEPDIERLLAGDHIYSQWQEREAEMMAATLMDAAWSKAKIGEFYKTFQNLIFGEKEKSLQPEKSLQKVADLFLRFDC